MPTLAGTARLATLLIGIASVARGQEAIFADDFESANLFRWSARAGEPLAPAEVFRTTDLDLRDPHVYVDLGFSICFDFTDQDLPLTPGSAFNAQIAASMSTDGDGDGFLDSSLLLTFRPFDEGASGLRLDIQGGLCSAPIAGTSCAPDPLATPQTTTYDGVASGVCLVPLAGTTYGPYAPEVPEPIAPGFVSRARTMTLALAGLPVPLRGVRLAGAASGAPVDRFENGLLMGFLAESDADQILLPADLPLVGGEPLSILLPGGSGNCAGHDDRDSFDAAPGWWFYFEFPADLVPWSGE